MATTTVTRPHASSATLRPPASTRPSVIDEGARRLQFSLFVAGAVLMPLGLLAIGLGWYGVAHSHYVYDQNTYLISGGLLGLGLVFLGGYFGAWLARMSAEQRDNSRAIADAMSVLADALGQGRRAGGDHQGGSSMAAAAAAAAVAAVAASHGPVAPAPGEPALPTTALPTAPAAAAQQRPPGAVLTDDDEQLVTAGNGNTVHRRDCGLIETREDLHAYRPGGQAVSTCRVCRPQL